MAIEHFKHQDIIIRIQEKYLVRITVIKELNYRIEKYCDIPFSLKYIDAFSGMGYFQINCISTKTAE